MAGQVSAETERVAQSSTGGTAIAGKTAKGMGQVKSTTEQLAGRVRDLGQRSGQIGAIVETIGDIAAQTNLLALNAAIEAARAGNHGKGFAVVADEVRKLAERAAKATKEIAEMIRAVQIGASEAVEAMQETGEDVTSAVTLTGQASDAFQAISAATRASIGRVQAIRGAIANLQETSDTLGGAVNSAASVAGRNRESAEAMSQTSQIVVESLDRVNAVVEENTAATEQMAASSTEVTQSIENIAGVSEENSASVEEVSAQVQEVAASAHTLLDLARILQEVVAQFRVLEDGAAAAPAPPPAVTPTPMATVRANGNDRKMYEMRA